MTDPSINFLFLISTFISPCLVTFHRSLLEMILGHHILNIYLRHLFTKVCSLHWIFIVTNQVSHPYKSTDFTQALNILILVPFRSDLDSHTLLNLDNDPLDVNRRLFLLLPKNWIIFVIYLKTHYLFASTLTTRLYCKNESLEDKKKCIVFFAAILCANILYFPEDFLW